MLLVTEHLRSPLGDIVSDCKPHTYPRHAASLPLRTEHNGDETAPLVSCRHLQCLDGKIQRKRRAEAFSGT